MSDENEENENSEAQKVIPTLDPQFANTSLSDVNYGNEEEDDVEPPDIKNKAPKVNVGNIFAIIFILLGIVMLIFLVFSDKKAKNNKNNAQLDKSGIKNEHNFDRLIGTGKTETEHNEILTEFNNEAGTETETLTTSDSEVDIDKILGTLPPEYQIGNPQAPVGTAPIATSSSSSSSKSTRPDTRNSKSPRTSVAGIKGLEPTQSNSQIVSSVMNGTYNNYGNYGYGTTTAPVSRDDYYQQQINALQQLQGTMAGQNTAQQNPQTYYQSNRENFYNAQANNAGSGSFLSATSLWDGTIISAVLLTKINTDNPGIVIARVSENVYSSYDHSFLVIPEGSLLYATYNSSVSYGQNRVQVAWNLLIRPDGYRVQLGNMNGVDVHGASGYEGFVNNHPFETLKALGIIAVFSLIQTDFDMQMEDQTMNDYVSNAMADVYKEVTQLEGKIVDKALDIKPTITIREGTEIKLITNTPLELPPVEIYTPTQQYVRTN